MIEKESRVRCEGVSVIAVASLIEADAQAATERMGLPTVLMFVGFMVLLGYPALQQIVRAL
jgi:hypothetical protein